MAVWPSTTFRHAWDYGAPWIAPGSVLWSGMGTISPTKLGTFEIRFPTATMARWPRRCEWILQLDWSGGTHAELLAEGVLHLRQSVARSVAPVVLLTDDLVPILTDDDGLGILLDGSVGQ
jgi:hypothetical protein